jgi:hypothetical protein
MKRALVVAAAITFAAGSFAAAEPLPALVAHPALVIAQFAQAVPPEPPVTAELAGGCGRCAAMKAQHAAMKAPNAVKNAGPGAPKAAGHACACCKK